MAAFWRVSGDFDFSPCVFRSRPISSPKEGVGGRPRGPHHRAARAPPGPRRPMVWGPRASTSIALLAPLVSWENRAFCINSEDFPESWISAQKRDTRAVLLKTALVRVSCIQNTQIRGKTIAKVFGKVDTFWTYHAVLACGGPLARLRLSFGVLGSSGKNKILGLCFVEFREYYPNSLSGTKNNRKQELTLWHLVNRLVPENA